MTIYLVFRSISMYKTVITHKTIKPKSGSIACDEKNEGDAHKLKSHHDRCVLSHAQSAPTHTQTHTFAFLTQSSNL